MSYSSSSIVMAVQLVLVFSSLMRLNMYQLIAVSLNARKERETAAWTLNVKDHLFVDT